jgi:hypothetical protein
VTVAVPHTLDTLYLTVSSPAETPVITPADDTETLPVVVLHTPPPTVDVKVVVAATQTTAVPEIVPATGSGLTVFDAIAIQPVGSV